MEGLILSGAVLALSAGGALGQKTHAPTPTNFKFVPTSVPTSIPTSSPTYGPSSMTVVEYIMGGVLGGILLLVITYFLMGYWMYVSEMEAYERLMDNKDKREEAARRRAAIPHGEMFKNDALPRAPKQLDIEKELGGDEDDEDDEEAAGSKRRGEKKPLLSDPAGGGGPWKESSSS